jgi:hypothetical protein
LSPTSRPACLEAVALRPGVEVVIAVTGEIRYSILQSLGSRPCLIMRAEVSWRRDMRCCVRKADFSAAIDAQEPIANEVEHIGGSDAQRDLMRFTLLRAYLRMGCAVDACRLLSV